MRRSINAAMLLLLLTPLATSFVMPRPSPAGQVSESAAGSIERKAILDAMRRAGETPDRIFVVRAMRVQDGWAWIVVDPRSRDGRSRYETESALLRGSADQWRVVDRPCEEDGCDARRETARIRAAHPQAPAAIFAGD